MMAAIWLTVAIAVVALEFARDAKERRLLGIDAAERGAARAAALGVLAQTQERLERAIRQVAQSGNTNTMLRGSDPWLDVDSLYSGSVGSDSAVQVNLRARDLGAQLNVNLLSEDELKTFFGYALNDYAIADQLAQSVMDWRDPDDIARPRGGERDAYVKAKRLALPANANFRSVSELLDVQGVTPQIYEKVAPFLTVRGNGTVNLNTAPPQVLRPLPGMTDAILTRILALRSQGRRIANANTVLPGAAGGRGGRGGPAPSPTQQRLLARTTVNTTDVEVTITARAGAQAQPVQLLAIIQRVGQNANISWRQW
jgi:type II secretory pathway component PulK